MLERKALLYDKLSKGIIVPDEEQTEHFLVNFDKKVPEKPQHETIEPDFPKKPLPYTANVKYGNFVPAQLKPTEVTDDKNTDLDPEETNETGAVHYQNVHFKEVRDHGVGYFSFSMDEEERKKQLDALNALRHRTEDQQKALLKKKRKKQALLKSRLAKVRLRKNIPSKESEDEDDNIDEEESNDEVEDTDHHHAEIESIAAQPVVIGEPKPVRVRPWDKGKDFSDLLPERNIKHKSVANQWVENKRAERVADFAPPQSYDHSTNRTYQRQQFCAGSKVETLFKENQNNDEEINNVEAAKIISEKISLIRRQL